MSLALLKRGARAALPATAVQQLQFLRRLPVYARIERSMALRRSRDVGEDSFFLTPEIMLRFPDDAIAHTVFQRMSFDSDTRREWGNFLALARGCRAFVDVGASGGFFSALFAATRPGEARILSIEPDPGARRVLENVRLRNGRAGVDWIIEERAAGRAEALEFVSSGYGAMNCRTAETRQFMLAHTERNLRGGGGFVAQAEALGDICRTHAFAPDLLKIDIEGMEHELIGASQVWLARARPRIHLEVHSPFIRERGGDPVAMLESLAALGYQPADAKPWRLEMDRARQGLFFDLDLLPS